MATTTKNENVETKISIRLPLLPDEGGAAEVNQNHTVTMNGRNIIIPRGQTVEVSPEIYQILFNSGRFEFL